MTVKEVASFLKISSQMVYNLVREGEIEAFKVGTALRILPEDIDRFIGRQKRLQLAGRIEGAAEGREGRFQVSHLFSHLGSFHLDDISFDIPLGASLGIIGASGSGKTLLLKTLAGLVPRDAGSVFLGTERLDAIDARDRRIGFVFQEYALYPRKTGAGNIAFPAEAAHVEKEEVEARVRELARRLGIGDEYLDRHVNALPEGMKQLVALARAENRQARLFMMDEPLVHLDPDLRRSMRALLHVIRRESAITTVYAFNEPDDALALSEWMLVIEAGRAVQFGRMEDVYRRPLTIGAMELLSPDGLNEARVEVRGGKTVPWGIDAPVADGDWILCFRPDEVELRPDGQVSMKEDYSVLRDGRTRMAALRLEDGTELRVTVPEAHRGDISFLPLEPRFFSAR